MYWGEVERTRLHYPGEETSQGRPNCSCPLLYRWLLTTSQKCTVCLVLKCLVLSLVVRDKSDTLPHGKFWLHKKKKNSSHKSGAAPAQGHETRWDLCCWTCSKAIWTSPWATWPYRRSQLGSERWVGTGFQMCLPPWIAVILCANLATSSHVLIRP